MKATEAKFLDFLKKSPQFVIPIYQRIYSWTEKECRQLWDDIIRAGSNDSISAHFVGSIVYIEKGLSNLTSQEPMLVIDGQQRLTTLTLILAALTESLDTLEEGKCEPVEGFSSRKIRNYYLLNPEEAGDRHYKLILSQNDRDSLLAILDGKQQPKDQSLRITENYALFKGLIVSRQSALEAVCKGLAKLIVVDIALNRSQDNPQLIFESMNSTGRELSQADLIRNFILMGLEPGLQSRLYSEFWRPMEVEFGQQAYGTHFDSFIRHYLTVKTREIPRLDQVYEAFKKHSRSKEVAEVGVEALVKDVREYARYYCAMALGAEPDRDLKLAFHDLLELTVDVAYPFLLELYHDYSNDYLSKPDFVAAVRLIEAYVFRRAICGIPTNSMNKTFANCGKALKKDRYLESVQAHFLLLPSYRRFPLDEEFKRDLQTRDLYNFRSKIYWLRRFENHGRKERVPVDEYTVEHIMPQNENLSGQWKAALGEGWEEAHKTWLHTLGNLTLTGYNSEYSDRSFLEKRDMPGGFKESPLKINHGLGQLSNWNQQEINARAARLAESAVDVWQAPKLDLDILTAYKAKPTSPTSYTINDHPQLSAKTIRDLFEAFRKEVLALDPCVTEEILKLYIAYKAETNFVDVIPQAKRLRLSINIDYVHINDPRGLCRNVAGLGRWGNGDVEVGLSNLEEIPYIIGIVRQAFERQMVDARE